MKHSNLLRTIAFILFFPTLHSAQRTAVYADPDNLYKQGLELFDKQQFTSAQKSFKEYAALSAASSLLKADAQFYAAACGIELFNKDGEYMMRQFIASHPSSTKLSSAWFALGKSSYRKKKYSETIDAFEKVDLYKLNKNELAEFYFKRGYSLLQLNQDEKAKQDFFEIKEVDNKYAMPATYYYSHLAYKEKNYEMALAGFNKLLSSESFGSASPYYITQIYFIQGKYAQVVKEAPKLLNDSSNVQKESEINRMIGESYFHMKDFKNALVYLKKTNVGNAQGNYALVYCYYKLNDCQNAVVHLEKATSGSDTLAQNAWYHMADCYIKLNDKLKAKNAFYSSYQIKVDKQITEESLFSFAKLSYELDFSPYNEAVKGFSKYLFEYPKSKHADECYQFLINVYSTTRNYDEAIKSMENLGGIDPVLRVTYQKLIYFYGIDFFNNNDLENARKQFTKSLTQNSDPRLNALNLYWLAEVAYLKKDYSTAINTWKKFQVTDGALQLDEYLTSNYALGYAYFKRKEAEDYSNANISFRKFLMGEIDDDDKKSDATIRAADCYFMNRDFVQASDYYKKAIALNNLDLDYALYQKALCDGLNRNYTEKVNELKKIEAQHPKSNYLIASINEIADTYYNNLKDQNNAVIYYEKILSKYPNSSFVSNAYAQLGNIYYERKQDDRAFEYYDKFVRMNSKSDAAKDVMDAIRKIFEAKGDIDAMEKYFAEIGNPLSGNQLEKASYTAAYDAFYTQKNCDDAMPKWESYIAKFPNGRYITEAWFSLAECAYSKNIFDKALEGYRYVIEKPRSLYSETSLSKATYLLYKDKKYEEALPLFIQLQEIAEVPANKSAARLGAMRSAFNLKNYEVALEESNKVLGTDKLSPQQTSEAKYIKAKSLYETNRLDDALTEFKSMTKSAKNVTGAEAYYHVAKIQFVRQEYKAVVKTVTDLISYSYSNDDWNNKGMLLLSDAYLALGDATDAKIILETIIDAQPKQEYLDEARKRLESIKEKELQQQNTAPPESMQLQFNETGSDSTLFNKNE